MLNKYALIITNIYNAKMGEEMNILQSYRQLVTLNHLMKYCTIKKVYKNHSNEATIIETNKPNINYYLETFVQVDNKFYCS